jgi:hypothetical protein
VLRTTTTVTGAIVAALLLGAGVAAAQTGAPPGGPTAQAIIPVTGPSVGPAPEVVPAMIPAEPKGGEITPKGGKARTTAALHSTPKTVKVVHKPGAKSTVKKTAPTTKQVAKVAGTAKGKHLAQTKHKAPIHHAMAGKPGLTPKHHAAPPAAKEGVTSQPVLPRV